MWHSFIKWNLITHTLTVHTAMVKCRVQTVLYKWHSAKWITNQKHKRPRSNCTALKSNEPPLINKSQAGTHALNYYTNYRGQATLAVDNPTPPHTQHTRRQSLVRRELIYQLYPGEATQERTGENNRFITSESNMTIPNNFFYVWRKQKWNFSIITAISFVGMFTSRYKYNNRLLRGSFIWIRTCKLLDFKKILFSRFVD